MRMNDGDIQCQHCHAVQGAAHDPYCTEANWYARQIPAADGDGWITWDGGECPVPKGTLVDVKYRYGGRSDGMRAGFKNTYMRDASRWSHLGTVDDIVAYRLSVVAPTEATEGVPERQSADDGWITYDGRLGAPKNLRRDTLVEWKDNQGLTGKGRANQFYWSGSSVGSDWVVAYRVLEEVPADADSLASETLQSLGWTFVGNCWVQEQPTDTEKIADHMSHPLYPVLIWAIDQAMYGKGERHGGNVTPFLEQPWVHYAKMHGRGFLTGQAAKKLEEAASKREGEAFVSELLGAIVYAGMAVLWEKGEVS